MKKVYVTPVIEDWGKVADVTKTLGISGPSGGGKSKPSRGGKSKPSRGGKSKPSRGGKSRGSKGRRADLTGDKSFGLV